MNSGCEKTFLSKATQGGHGIRTAEVQQHQLVLCIGPRHFRGEIYGRRKDLRFLAAARQQSPRSAPEKSNFASSLSYSYSPVAIARFQFFCPATMVATALPFSGQP